MFRISMRLLAAISLFISANYAIAAPTSYPIKCRPGPNTAFNLSVAGELRFGFSKAAVAAGTDGHTLNQGECAWVDRPLTAGEPSYIAAPIGPNFKVGVVLPHAMNTQFKAYMYAASQQWVMDFTSKDVILTLYVYSDGQYLRAPVP